MADRQGENHGDRQDPVLVRPYIGGGTPPEDYDDGVRDYHGLGEYYGDASEMSDESGGFSPNGHLDAPPSPHDAPPYPSPDPRHDDPRHDDARYDDADPRHDGAGYDSASYDSAGYDSAGYDSAGYDSAGYGGAGDGRGGAGLDDIDRYGLPAGLGYGNTDGRGDVLGAGQHDYAQGQYGDAGSDEPAHGETGDDDFQGEDFRTAGGYPDHGADGAEWAGDGDGDGQQASGQAGEAGLAAVDQDGTREIPRQAGGPPGPAPRAATAAGRRSALLRQRLVVLAGVGVLALGAAGAFLFLRPDDNDQARPGVESTVDEPGGDGTLGEAPATGAASAAPSGKPRTSVKASEGATAGRGDAGAGSQPVPGTQPSQGGAPAEQQSSAGAPTPTETLSPPPEAALTGAVTSSGGRCLAFGGLFVLDGSPINVSGCSGVSYQRFTLTPEGTLTVNGKCSQVDEDGEVSVITCDERQESQWRRGPDGSLVNLATGGCLTDPGTSGATATVETCTGAADQSWTFPTA